MYLWDGPVPVTDSMSHTYSLSFSYSGETPIWIHAHENVIACQLFSHVMGDVHGCNRDMAGVFMDASAWRL